jgi:hypothetical protein
MGETAVRLGGSGFELPSRHDETEALHRVGARSQSFPEILITGEMGNAQSHTEPEDAGDSQNGSTGWLCRRESQLVHLRLSDLRPRINNEFN